MTTNIWLIFRYIEMIFYNILPKSVRYLIEIWSIFSGYPFIIFLISLISGVQISSKTVPLGGLSLRFHAGRLAVLGFEVTV